MTDPANLMEEASAIDMNASDTIDPDAAGLEDAMFITKITTIPLVCKLALNPLHNRAQYVRMQYHGHFIGDDPTNRKMCRTHPCQKSLGAKTCPECDAYYAKAKRLKELKELKQTATAEYKRLEIETDIMKPVKGGWLLVIKPEDPKIRALKAKQGLINQLWGAPETSWTPAVPSLVSKMIEKGHNPFGLKQPTGWLKFWKTGEEKATRYHAAANTETKTIDHEGEKVEVEAYVKLNYNPAILKLKASEVPDVMEYEKRSAFTVAESEEFCKTFRAPDRFQNQKGGVDEDSEGGAETSTRTEAPSKEEAMAAVSNNVEAATPVVSQIDQAL